MIPWLQIYDKVHYGKWLPEFWSEISNLPEDIDIHMPSIFSHSITGKPYSSIPTDLWIEMTMNKGSKMKAGWQRILANENILCAHIRSGNYINKLRANLHSLCNMKKYISCHKENTPSRLKADELGVQDINACIDEFNSDPFDSVNSRLRTLHSGQYASEEIEADILSAGKDGEQKVSEFFKDSVFSSVKEWAIKKSNRKTFLTTSVSEKTSAKMTRTVSMENNAMSSIITKFSGKNITLFDILQHRVTTECLSLFNPNGAMIKTQKSKLLESFTFNQLDASKMNHYAALVDMGFMWRLCFPSAEDREKNDESHFTWRDYASKIFTTITGRHTNADVIIFVNDPYDLTESLKSEEHENRKSNFYIHGSRNVHIKPMDKLPNKTNLASFFANKSNKMRLQEYLKNEFRSKVKSFPGKTFIYSVQRECENLRSGSKMPDYECNHQEADTIIFYLSTVLRKNSFENTIVIDAEDTDVIALSAYASREHDLNLGIRKKKSTFDCYSLCSPEIASIIVKIHVLTGADTTSGFFGRGKKAVLKNVHKNIHKAKELLETFGKSLNISEECYKDVILFIIRFVYNDNKSVSPAESRCLFWKRMKKKSTQRLPPDEESLRWHIMRSNYVVHTIMNYNTASYTTSSPSENGWNIVDDACVPIRYKNPCIPESFSSYYIDTTVSDQDDDYDEDDVIDELDHEESDSDNDFKSDVDY